MMKEMPTLPLVGMPLVDVRDVAEAHLQAILKPEAANKRFMLVARTVMFTEMGVWLNDKYGAHYDVAHKPAPKMMMQFIGMFDK